MNGALQRRDAYIALAVFAELLLPPVHFTNEVLLLQRTPQKFGYDEFDVRDDPLFWAELKAGMVRPSLPTAPSYLVVFPGTERRYCRISFYWLSRTRGMEFNKPNMLEPHFVIWREHYWEQVH